VPIGRDLLPTTLLLYILHNHCFLAEVWLSIIDTSDGLDSQQVYNNMVEERLTMQCRG
jgi:hypothetical protein